MKYLKQKSVALAPETWRELADIARQSNVTPSDIIRRAVASYLKFQKNGFWNPSRIAETCEFNQLAIAVLLGKIAPDELDAIINAVRERMDKYHGE